VLCFVDADLPMLGTLSFNGHELLNPRALAKRLNATGSTSADAVRTLAGQLARRFPSA
jgi:hypothetical protein